MRLDVDVRHRFGGFALDARFTGEAGLTALFGRSGSGKTSLVNIVAGLVRPDEGRVVVDGRVLVDRAAGVFVPRHRRRIGYIFQESRLFPHLSVRHNLLYGRWFTRAADRRDGLDRVVAILGIDHLLDRRPAGLSGGERQRVAIGRALLASPRILLMDEPLAALDHARKAEILPYIERLRDEAGIPILYVSHAIDEVARLAGTVVLMAGGRVLASGPAGQILARVDLEPLAGADEAGAVLEGRVESVDDGFGLATVHSPAGPLLVPGQGLAAGARLRLRIRARDVMLATVPPQGISALNQFAGRIVAIAEGQGAAADVQVACGAAVLVARVTRRSVEQLGLRPGLPVFAVVKSVAIDPG
ncbi:molybdate transport system ATP-binding protein [Stella humosa]|uniref:Molybdate transport system ATP-binding protein n=1 Tax=Stella humosa TaxID=94 RepID=A0A3N1L0K8_9PROT|nr:molybdenum ABC transporter ATP-binding protein [Stella humosa]ROP83986.1 molybdate transport system ATP-binding protein [Stella humosa]